MSQVKELSARGTEVRDNYAVEVAGLRRVYRTRGFLGRSTETVALDGIDLRVPAGMVFGILGPNGAGKTTLVRILSTLLTPTAGTARVLGFDVARQPAQVRKRIGLILGGERGLYGRLTARENLKYFGALNGMSPRVAAVRADELLGLVGLSERADRPVEQYSRGMRQRVHIARGLLTDPPVVFMDEPTIGLDPIASRELRDIVPQLARSGKTVLLTTHYMLEADSLCERIALINHGKLVALGSPADIKRQFSGIRVIDVTIRDPRPGLADAIQGLAGVQRVESGAEGALQRLAVQVLPTANVKDVLVATIGADNVETLVEREPNLEEAYLNILK